MITITITILLYKIWNKDEGNDIVDFVIPCGVLIFIGGLLDLGIIYIIKKI